MESFINKRIKDSEENFFDPVKKKNEVKDIHPFKTCEK